DRDRNPRLDPRRGPRRLFGIEVSRPQPRSPAGDGQQRDVDLADLADLLEPAGVAGEVDRAAGAAKDEADGVAATVLREPAPVVLGADRLDLDPADARVAAGTHHL